MDNIPQLKKNFSLSSLLFGDQENSPLEVRIFNAIMVLAFTAAFLTMLMNIFIKLPFSNCLLCIIVMAITSVGYFYSLSTNGYEKIFGFIALLSLLLLLAWWVPAGGSKSGHLYYFFILIVSTIPLIRNKLKILFLCSTVASAGILLCLEYSEIFELYRFPTRGQQYLDVGAGILICLAFTGTLMNIILSEYGKERAVREKLILKIKEDNEKLEKAFEEIRILKGRFPVCTVCKKIRDDQGTWNNMEQYIEERTQAEFTHAVCPDCATAFGLNS